MLHTTPPPDPAALARRPDTPGPLAVATPTTRRLADASLSVNTRRAYLGALARLDAWRGTAPVDDASLAVYLGALFVAGRAPATAALAVAAVRCRATLAGQPAPAGEATARVLGGFRRTAADRGRGQAAPLRADGLAFCGKPKDRRSRAVAPSSVTALSGPRSRLSASDGQQGSPDPRSRTRGILEPDTRRLTGYSTPGRTVRTGG